MGHVTESIWDNKHRIIPLAEVSHIEKYTDLENEKNRILIIFKHSKMNRENGGDQEPNVYLTDSFAVDFLSAWSRYRHELEKDTLADIH